MHKFFVTVDHGETEEFFIEFSSDTIENAERLVGRLNDLAEETTGETPYHLYRMLEA